MEITNVEEFEKLAKEKLPKMVFDYYSSAAQDQWSLKENRNAFSRILFRPRILIDVSHIDTTTSILGHKINMPIMIAPTAMQRMAHPEGECATCRAASSAGTVTTISSWSTCSFEEVASTGEGIRFFQLYIMKDRNIAVQLVRKAENAGFKGIVLTADTPWLARREADVKNKFSLPSHLSLKNFEGLDFGDQANHSGSFTSLVSLQTDPTFSWKDLQWLKTVTKLPILVKGVLTAEDAKLAIEAGAAGVIVSNHGARQLDYLPAPISVLEEIVKAVQGQIPVFMDGGIRRGTDVFKALALGASGVFIGRPVLFSLAVDGEVGVKRMLQIFRDEFQLTMALNGCRSLKEITRKHVFPNTRHRLCIWHLIKSAVSRLGALKKDATIKKEFRKCLTGCVNKDEFQTTWDAMISNYNLSNSKWFKRLYKLRDKWCTTLSKDFFSAGILSSQRSESTNNAVGFKANKNTSLTDFFKIFNKTIARWRRKESDADFKCAESLPSTFLPMFGQIKHATEVYTQTIFRDFECEYKYAIASVVKTLDEVGSAYTYEVWVEGQEKSKRLVSFNDANNMVECSCKNFEEVGWLCYHALRILIQHSVTRIPESYIKKRCTKIAKEDVWKKKNNSLTKTTCISLFLGKI